MPFLLPRMRSACPLNRVFPTDARTRYAPSCDHGKVVGGGIITMKDEYQNIKRERWKIIPDAIPRVRRNCPKCKEKREFINSMKFRVNANGKNLDVWLIYRCKKCSATWNMAVYERCMVNEIPVKEYEGFLRNDCRLAEYFGSKGDLFAKNKAEAVLADGGYRVERYWEDGDRIERIRAGEDRIEEVQMSESQTDRARQADGVAEYQLHIIEIETTSPMAVRLDSLLAEQLGVSRSMIKQLCGNGEIFKLTKVESGAEQGGKLYREKIRNGMVIGIRNTSL